MKPKSPMRSLSSREFFRNPAAAKKEAENAPVIINEYGSAAFVFLPFMQYEALLQAAPLETPIEMPMGNSATQEEAKNTAGENGKNNFTNVAIEKLSDRLSDGIESVQQEISLLATDVNLVLEKSELVRHDLQHAQRTSAAVESGQEAISLLPNPQAFIDGIQGYHDEVMDEMAILADEAKAMLRNHYVAIPKRAARWSWFLVLLALAICGVLTAFAYGQEQRAAFYYAQAEDAKAHGAQITSCNRHDGKKRCVVY